MNYIIETFENKIDKKFIDQITFDKFELTKYIRKYYWKKSRKIKNNSLYLNTQYKIYPVVFSIYKNLLLIDEFQNMLVFYKILNKKISL